MGGTHALIPAAGRGERYLRSSVESIGPSAGPEGAASEKRRAGDRYSASNKLFARLAGKPVLAHTLEAFDRCEGIDGIVVVGSAESFHLLETLVRDAALSLPVRFVEGGATRQESVYLGLLALPGDAEIVAVHDAARPLVTAAVIARTIEAARRHGAAVACVPATDTVKQVDAGGRITGTLPRASLRAAQTPQTFRVPLLLRAHEAARRDGVDATDDAALVERLGEPVLVVDGDRRNLKITTPEDMRMAEALLAGASPETAVPEAGSPAPSAIRVGFGYDIHPLVEGRRLVLGGVEIPHSTGLDGHSDADVLLHAVMDALLGAAGLPDIGHLFPNTDERWRGASSRHLLREVAARVRETGYRPSNVDVTLIAERPKIAPHIPAMRSAIATDLGVPESFVGIKATTNEQVGSLGREEAMAAHAVAVVVALG